MNVLRQVRTILFVLALSCGVISSLRSDPENSDGFQSAPPGAAQYPTLLDGYTARPPWKVAGVDYAVGFPRGGTLKVPTAQNLPKGVSLRSGAIHIEGANVTLDRYDLSGLTVMIDDSASGTVTVTNCSAEGVVIRSTVSAAANVVVSYCTLDGAGTASDPNFQTIKVWCPITVKYSWIKNSTGGIQGGASLNVMYNLLEGFVWSQGSHANAIYIRGTNAAADATLIAYNTIYSQAVRSNAGFPVGIGAAIAFFDDGGNFYDSTVANNTMISALPGGASYLIGFYVRTGSSAINGKVRDNYLASVNGFGRPGSGAFGPFYPGSTGLLQANYSDNIDMNTGRLLVAGRGEGQMAGPSPR
jgi:hypothetical protein